MDAFPANAIEDPFLGPGEQDPATQGHRGSSPQRANVFNISMFDAIDRDGRVPVQTHDHDQNQYGASGAGEGDDNDDLPPSPSPSSPTTPTPINDYSGSFTESTAATTLVSLGAGWSSPSPQSSNQFASYQELQTTICPEAVRPRTFSAAPTLLVPSLPFPLIDAQEHLRSPPPPYASGAGDGGGLGSSSLVMPTHTSFDVPAHHEVYGPDSFSYEPEWHSNSQQDSFYSSIPAPTEPAHTEATRYDSWPFGSYEGRSSNSHSHHYVPRRRRALSTSSIESSETWTTAPVTPAPSHLQMSRATSTSDLTRSPAVSMLEPKLDVTVEPEEDAPHEIEDGMQEYDIKAEHIEKDYSKADHYNEDEEELKDLNVEEAMPVAMDSPTEVFHQLTDPIDVDGTEVTEAPTDDDDDYVDKEEEKDEEWSRAPVRQAQNHRRTFKMALWDTINDPAFSDLIRWSDDGSSGLIPDKNKFQSSKAMRAITDARDFGGFVRQLHMWGFSRFRVPDYGDRSCGFSHIRFKRNRLDLLEDMRRKGETKPIRPATTRKRKNAPRAKRNQSITPPVATAGESSTPAPKPKPKSASRPRKAAAKAKAKQGELDNSPIENLESASFSPPPRARRSTGSTLSQSAILHRQSAERDTPVPPPRKCGRTSAQTEDVDTSSDLAFQNASGPSKEASTSSSTKRPAPSPDMSFFPLKTPKSAKTRAKTRAQA